MKLLLSSMALMFVIVNASAQETQVPMDLEGKILSIDRSLRDKLELFVEYPGFSEARLFQQNDTLFWLEVIHLRVERQVRSRVEMNLSEVQVFRRLVSNRATSVMPGAYLDQSGRRTFLVTSFTTAYFYHGWALPLITDVHDPASVMGVYLLTSGAGFFIPFMVSTNMEITAGMGRLNRVGQIHGIFHGALIPLLFTDFPEFQVTVGMGMAFSLAENILSLQIARNLNFSEGRSSVIGNTGIFGGLAGFSTSLLLHEGESARLNAFSALVGMGTGYAAGYLLSENTSYSRGDAIVSFTAAMLPIAATASLLSYTETIENRVIGAGFLLSSVGGVALGHHLTKRHNFATDDAYYIALGALAGGLIGLGLGNLAGADSKAILTTSTLGATGGFALMYSLYASGARMNSPASANFDIAPHFMPSIAPDGHINHKLYPGFRLKVEF